MEINFSTFNLLESVIYRANIFNYDNKFLASVRETNTPIIVKYDDVPEHSYIHNLQKFLKLKAKEQLENISRIDIKFREETEEYEEQAQRNYSSSSSESKMFLCSLVELVNNYVERLEAEDVDYENDDVSRLKEVQHSQRNYRNAILFCLLYLDGLVMIDVDNINKINFVAESHKVNLVPILKTVLKSKAIEVNLKEVASHLLSAVIGFCELVTVDDESIETILAWTKEHHIVSKRDNVLTSNFGLMFTRDKCILYFLKIFDSDRRILRTLFDIMKKDNFNIIYEALFAVWNVSNFSENVEIFENKNDNFLETIVSVIKTNKIDKIARNLLTSQRCLEVLLDISFMKTIDTLLTNKWNDPLIKEFLNSIYDYLDKNYKFLNSFEKYMKEIESGNLKWGSLHTNDFWEDNFKEFEREGFKYIKMLCEIVNRTEPVNNSDKIEMIAVACYDIGEFARLYPGGALILEGMKIKERLMTFIVNSNLEIKNRALVCLQKIMMRTIRN